MAISLEAQIFESFKGIRELNGVNAGGEISALVCDNVELVQTEIGSSTGIKTMEGNAAVYSLPEGYKILGIFQSFQENITYKFIYAENDTKGTLFYINLLRQPEILIDNLTKTGECNGITMSSTAYDVFVFTNGEEAKTVCFTSDISYGDRVKTISATDYLGRSIKWLSMTEWNGFLVVASQYGVHSSHQNDIYTWNDNPDDVADSWYIDFSKKVTAVFSYTRGLYIFTNEDITFLNTTPNDSSNAKQETTAGVGCFSYSSIVKHDLGLFFYDNKQKNIYYIQNIDNGQTRPAGPVAREIQSHFNDVRKFKMFSCIYENKNEVWCIINDSIYIYNFVLNEWVKRTEQSINAICLIKNDIFSGGDEGIVYAENINTLFNGEFYPAIYQTTFINLGSNSNLKKQKTPLLLVINDSYRNDFWVELTVNSKEKNPKRVRVKGSGGGIYAPSEENEDVIIPDNQKYDSAVYAGYNPYSKKVIEITTPQTWYTLGVKIYTDTPGQGFYISSMELKNIKAKLKTRGR